MTHQPVLPPPLEYPTAHSVGLDDAFNDWREIARRLWRHRLGWPMPSALLARELRSRTLLRGDAVDTARADLLMLSIDQFHRSGVPGGQMHCVELERMFQSAGDQSWSALARLFMAREHGYRGNREEAEALFRRWFENDAGFVEAEDVMWARGAFARLLIDLGRDAEGFRLHYQALDMAASNRRSPERVLVQMNAGVAQLRFGNAANADPLFDAAWHEASALGMEQLFHVIAGNRARCKIHLGDFVAASAALAPVATANGMRADRGFFEVMMADVERRLGHIEEARDWLDRGLNSLGPTHHQNVQLVALTQRISIGLLREEGRLAEAAHLLREAEGSPPSFTTYTHELELFAEAAALNAQLEQWDLAYRYQRLEHDRHIELQRMAARAEYLSLQARYDLHRTQVERDFERDKREEAESARALVEQLNQQLSARLGEIETLQAALREQVIRDPLTGLHNRRFLDEALPREIGRACAEASVVSLALIDLDGFKELNDTYGHVAGDEVLRRLGELMRELTRSSDICCRFGGEEFCLIFPGSGAGSAAERLLAIQRRFRSLSVLSDGVAIEGLSFSGGVAECPRQSESGDRLLALADAALYRAKAAGKDRIEISDPA